MSLILRVIGTLGCSVSLVFLIIQTVQKKPAKKPLSLLIILGISVILVLFGASIAAPTAAADPASSAASAVRPTPSTAPEDGVSMDEESALQTANSYLEIAAFSYKGLIEQLEYEGYSTDEATYAANNCGADWNEQAARSAESYLNRMTVSRTRLIDLLEEYEGFTRNQAVYGADANGY